MRQAGRYLPQYRELREKHSLRELFFTPDLATQVTLMPIEELDFDAAILFSDIMTIALALGLKLDFQEGPKIDPMVRPEHVDALPFVYETLSPIWETIRLLKQQLSVPLIGFCGAPFTVASYLVEGGLEGIKKWVYRFPQQLEWLLEKIACASIFYLENQVQAGVDAIQIFDSWANVLSKEQFLRFCLPFYRRLIDAAKVPVILFARSLVLHIEEIKDLPCALSCDWSVPLSTIRKTTTQTLQGNLDPDFLYAPLDVVRQETRQLLLSMKEDRAFIAALGHGIKPDTPVAAVKTMVQTVREWIPC